METFKYFGVVFTNDGMRNRTSTSCSKILNDKKYFNRVKNFRAHSVFRASTSCLKILNDKKYFNTVKIFRANSVFWASASCSKILNDKNYFSTVNSGQILFFRASTKLLKNPEWQKYIQCSEKFQGKHCFQGKRKLLKIPEL